MFTKEAYTWFQKLQFKNLLGKFDVEAAENEVEKAFREVTEQEEIERIFSEAKKAECVGAALIKCDGNVLPLFAHPSGYGRIALAIRERSGVFHCMQYGYRYGCTVCTAFGCGTFCRSFCHV